eukprot:SAG11_NODE_2673_length_3109_cov_1.528904_2_plen_69_part_00
MGFCCTIEALGDPSSRFPGLVCPEARVEVECAFTAKRLCDGTLSGMVGLNLLGTDAPAFPMVLHAVSV